MKNLNRIASHQDKLTAIYESGVIQDSLSTFDEVKYTQEAVGEFLKTMLKLAADDDLALFICEKGIVSIIENVTHYIQDDKIADLGAVNLEFICIILKALFASISRVDESVALIINNKGLEIIRDLLKSHPTHETIIRHVFCY
jgi:hypothetical protein